MLLGASLSGKLKEQLEKLKPRLEHTRIFNAASSLNKFWNTKELSKRI